jgi:hypothetical protein
MEEDRDDNPRNDRLQPQATGRSRDPWGWGKLVAKTNIVYYEPVCACATLFKSQENEPV